MDFPNLCYYRTEMRCTIHFHPDSDGFMRLEEALKTVRDIARIDRLNPITAAFSTQYV
jgi:hypothetical protein